LLESLASSAYGLFNIQGIGLGEDSQDFLMISRVAVFKCISGAGFYPFSIDVISELLDWLHGFSFLYT
jgi:hypothetical protein